MRYKIRFLCPRSSFLSPSELLKLFITMELIDWTKLCSAHETELRRGTDASPATRLFSSLEARGDARWEIFHKRVIEHVNESLFVCLRISCNFQNIRVIAKYYSRISLARMSELLCLSTKVNHSLRSRSRYQNFSCYRKWRRVFLAWLSIRRFTRERIVPVVLLVFRRQKIQIKF